jgi:hypothetical protein
MKAAAVNPAKTNRTGSAPRRRSQMAGGEQAKSTAIRSSAGDLEGITMKCSICKDLERALESRRSKYIEALSAAYYRVSTELAAHKNVDMERAKSDLEEHRLVCGSRDKRSPELLDEAFCR